MSWFLRRDLWLIPGVYLLFGFILFLSQDRLIYLPDQTPTTQCETPGTIIETEDGVRGYYLPQPEATTLVVLYHGNAGRACQRHFYTGPVHEAGHSLFLVEYPGYGETEQRPRTDLLLKHTYGVAEHLDTLPYESITLIGESIGSGFASYHATHQSVDHLLLISPLDTLSRRAQRAIPIYPVRLMLRTDLLISEWSSTAPHTTIILAERDEVIPTSHSRAVYEALPSEHRDLIIIEGAGHNTLYSHPDFPRAIRNAL